MRIMPDSFFVNYIGHAGLDVWLINRLYNLSSINHTTPLRQAANYVRR
jgi:hypothetical protein